MVKKEIFMDYNMTRNMDLFGFHVVDLIGYLSKRISNKNIRINLSFKFLSSLF